MWQQKLPMQTIPAGFHKPFSLSLIVKIFRLSQCSPPLQYHVTEPRVFKSLVIDFVSLLYEKITMKRKFKHQTIHIESMPQKAAFQKSQEKPKLQGCLRQG